MGREQVDTAVGSRLDSVARRLEGIAREWDRALLAAEDLAGGR